MFEKKIKTKELSYDFNKSRHLNFFFFICFLPEDLDSCKQKAFFFFPQELHQMSKKNHFGCSIKSALKEDFVCSAP
jgi:hypothetical protein